MLHMTEKKSVIVMITLFFFAFILYVFSEAVLRQNTLSAVKPDSGGEYSRLVGWLPQEAKLAIEYRAKYLYYEQQVEKARDLDKKVNAMFLFADYIKVRDKEGSERVLTDVVFNPKYNTSRRAYKSFARLMLSKSHKRQISIKEYQDHIKSLKWDEDILDAWTAGLTQLYALRASHQVFLEYLAPLLENPPAYTNYNRFFQEIQRRATALKDPETAAKATAIIARNNKGRLALSNEVLKADLDFRKRYQEMRDDIASAKTAEEKVSALTALALYTRGKINQESVELFDEILKNPEYMATPRIYYTLSKLLLNPGKQRVSIKDYQDRIKALTSELDIFSAWEAGLQRLIEIKAAPKVILEYLNPVFDKQPLFRDYLHIFEVIRDKATAVKDAELAAKAEAVIQKIKSERLKSLMDDMAPMP